MASCFPGFGDWVCVMARIQSMRTGHSSAQTSALHVLRSLQPYCTAVDPHHVLWHCCWSDLTPDISN